MAMCIKRYGHALFQITGIPLWTRKDRLAQTQQVGIFIQWIPIHPRPNSHYLYPCMFKQLFNKISVIRMQSFEQDWILVKQMQGGYSTVLCNCTIHPRAGQDSYMSLPRYIFSNFHPQSTPPPPFFWGGGGGLGGKERGFKNNIYFTSSENAWTNNMNN